MRSRAQDQIQRVEVVTVRVCQKDGFDQIQIQIILQGMAERIGSIVHQQVVVDEYLRAAADILSLLMRAALQFSHWQKGAGHPPPLRFPDIKVS